MNSSCWEIFKSENVRSPWVYPEKKQEDDNEKVTWPLSIKTIFHWHYVYLFSNWHIHIELLYSSECPILDMQKNINYTCSSSVQFLNLRRGKTVSEEDKVAFWTNKGPSKWIKTNINRANHWLWWVHTLSLLCHKRKKANHKNKFI